MAYFLIADCYSCGKTFGCNPDKVPSVPAHLTSTGTKEPVCKECIKKANPIRVKRGLGEIIILPGAYEPQPEPTDTDWKGNKDD